MIIWCHGFAIKKFGLWKSRGQKQPRTVNEGEKDKNWSCTKIYNASKPMLFLIFDMSNTVIKG